MKIKQKSIRLKDKHMKVELLKLFYSEKHINELIIDWIVYANVFTLRFIAFIQIKLRSKSRIFTHVTKFNQPFTLNLPYFY